MIIIDKNTFVSLSALANQLNLPDSYLRHLANNNLIPFLKINGRLRFHLGAVEKALAGLAAKGSGNEK
jgi:hypothetical protein